MGTPPIHLGVLVISFSLRAHPTCLSQSLPSSRLASLNKFAKLSNVWAGNRLVQFNVRPIRIHLLGGT